MLNFKRLERSVFAYETDEGEWLEHRCRVYCCDAYSSWQKPHIELTPCFDAFYPRKHRLMI